MFPHANPLAALLAAVVVAVAGCGGATTTPPATTDTGTAAAVVVTDIGKSWTLHGFDVGVVVEVTLLEHRRAVKGDDYAAPDPGNRFTAVKVRVRNVGTDPYDDNPMFGGAAVVDTDDQSYTPVGYGPPSPQLANIRVSPGDQRVGWLTFEVPKGADIRLLQFTADGGLGEPTGEWRLR